MCEKIEVKDNIIVRFEELILQIIYWDDTEYVKIGTGFLINNNGDFITAKHNVDLKFYNNYFCYYKNNYYKIYIKENINYSCTDTDIILLTLNETFFIDESFFLKFNHGNQTLLNLKKVVVYGYNNKGETLILEGTIAKYAKNRYYIDGANLGVGFSGAPVVLKDEIGTLIAVMSSREKLNFNYSTYSIRADNFGISYAFDINTITKYFNIETYAKAKILEFYELYNKMDGKQWEKILAYYLNHLNMKYKKVPNPIYIYNYYLRYKYLNYSFSEFLDFLYKNKYYSYFLGKIFEFISMTLINSGKIELVKTARIYLEKCIVIYDNLNFINDDIFKSILKIKWLNSITHKLENNYGIAKSYCDEIIYMAEENKRIYGLSYYDSVLIAEREIAVLTQDLNRFQFLQKHSKRWELNPIEAFHTYRRIFEYYLNIKNLDKAEEILMDVKRIYKIVKTELSPIYIWTLQRNYYQYFLLRNEKAKANNIYVYLMNEYNKYNIYGQILVLENLKKKYLF